MATPRVRAACEDLRADATKWTAAAEALRGAEQTAAGLTLMDKLGQIPQLAGSGKSFTGYEELRQKMTAALATGARVFDDISTILKQIADVYEREDTRNARRVRRAGGGR